MAVSARGGLPLALVRARDQLQAWRCRRRVGERVPRRLWALAVRLVKRYGVSRTATALRLDYYSLKKRIEAASREPLPSRPAFVELPSSVMAGKQCLFELDNQAGVSLRVQLVGYDTADLEALARSCWDAD